MNQAGAGVAFALMTLLIVAVVFFSNASDQPVGTDDVLRVGVLEESPPYDFFDETNQLAGMNIDLARDMARRLGRRVELVPVSYNRIVVGLLFHQYDVIVAPQSYSGERARTVRFLTPYLHSSDVLVYRNSRPIPLENLADVRKQGLKLGVFNGTSYPGLLKAQGLENAMSIYPTQREMFLAFEAGKIDVMLMDEQIAKHYRDVEKYPLALSVRPIRTQKVMAFSVRRQDARLAGALNQALDDMKRDGTVAAIEAKWLHPKHGTAIALKGDQ